jgi:peptidoglycan hydrolase CwlO-like protein
MFLSIQADIESCHLQMKKSQSKLEEFDKLIERTNMSIVKCEKQIEDKTLKI